jgi:hypothetical protein
VCAVTERYRKARRRPYPASWHQRGWPILRISKKTLSTTNSTSILFRAIVDAAVKVDTFITERSPDKHVSLSFTIYSFAFRLRPIGLKPPSYRARRHSYARTRRHCVFEACHSHRDSARYPLPEPRPVINQCRLLRSSNSSKPRSLRPRSPGSVRGVLCALKAVLEAESRGDEQLLVRGRDRDVVHEALRDAKANVCRSVTRLESPAGVNEDLFKAPE